MSVEDNPFWFIPSLQYMAAVKTVEILLRASDYKWIITSGYWSIYPDTFTSLRNRRKMLALLILQLEIDVDRLPIPQVLKSNVKDLLEPMIRTATDYLSMVVTSIAIRMEKQYWIRIIDDLIDNLQWDNFGCADGRKTLESYVSNRETVHFVIWDQLCTHFLEDDIIRFSRTFDWDRCEGCIDSVLTLYWYRKIYEKLPTPKMVTRSLYSVISSGLHMGYMERLLQEELILRCIVHGNVPVKFKAGRQTSAVAYLRKQLNNEDKFYKCLGRSAVHDKSGDLVLYALRTMNKNYSFETIHYESQLYVLEHLTRAPWILFIDNWISVFETFDAGLFILFFMWIGGNWTPIRKDGKATLYEPFEKVWRIYYRRFRLDDEKLEEAHRNIFAKEDFMLYKIMFKGMEGHPRKFLLNEVKNSFLHRKSYSHEYSKVFRERERIFVAQFSEHVLNNNVERELFVELLQD